MNVLYQCDDNYAPFCGVSITSLFENNKDIETIHIYLLDDGISDSNKRKFQECAQKYGRIIEFVDTSSVVQFLEENNMPKLRGSYTTWLKVFCVSRLGLKEGNLIYIDADTIVKSIKELEYLDMGDNCCGMVEAFEAFDYKKLAGLNIDKYFYAGMIVFDVENYLNQDCENEIINLISKKQINFPFHEQDVLNFLFAKDNVYSLDLKYDYPYLYEEIIGFESSKKVFNWPQDFYEAVVENSKDGRIYHCIPTFGKRPWHEGCIASEKAQWDYYLSISEWNDYQKQNIKIPITIEIQKLMAKYLPSFIYNVIYRYRNIHFMKMAAKKWEQLDNF